MLKDEYLEQIDYHLDDLLVSNTVFNRFAANSNVIHDLYRYQEQNKREGRHKRIKAVDLSSNVFHPDNADQKLFPIIAERLKMPLRPPFSLPERDLQVSWLLVIKLSLVLISDTDPFGNNVNGKRPVLSKSGVFPPVLDKLA